MTERPSRKTFRLRLEEMTSRLRDDIVSGKLAPGTFLPSELDLSKEFAMSNKTVRKGLDVLVQEGLIEKLPKKGNRVTEPGERQVTTVRFGFHHPLKLETHMELLLSEFQKLYPDIRVQPVELTSAGYGVVKDYLENDVVDLVTMNPFHLSEMAESGDIGLLEQQSQEPGHYPFLTAGFTKEDCLYVQPFVFSPVILCYNRKHFAEAGLPEPNSGWTWADLTAAAQRLAIRNRRFGFYFHLLSRTRWTLFLLQSGVSFRTERGEERAIDVEKLGKTLQTLWDLLYTPDVFPLMLAASNADAEEMFVQEKVSIIMTTYFGLNELKKAEFEYDIAPVPTLEEFRTLIVPVGLGLNRKSKAKPAARKLLDFMISPEGQQLIRRHTLSLPANRLAAERNETDRSCVRPSRFYMYREIIPSFRSLSDIGLTAFELSKVQKQLKLYLSGLLSLDEVCDLIVRQLAGDGAAG